MADTALATTPRLEHPTTPPRMTLAVVDKGVLSTAEVLGRAHRIKEIQLAVMKPNVHYGIIPGTQKPTLYQPGADVLNVTFQIAPRVGKIEDLSTAEAVRYRVLIEGEHQQSHAFLGEGAGECSSDEEKYRWRKAICVEEFDETEAHYKRTKWKRGSGGKTYKEQQVRTSPADLANTVLKMACKRAKIAMTLNVTGAGDVFAADLEDLADELRDHLVEGELVTPEAKTGPAMPQRQAPPATTPAPAAAEAREVAPAGLQIAEIHRSAAPPKVDPTTGVETPGRPFFVLELSDGARVSTYDAQLAADAATIKQKQSTVRLLTAAQADAEGGVEGVVVLVYTAPPAGVTASPRLDRILA